VAHHQRSKGTSSLTGRNADPQLLQTYRSWSALLQTNRRFLQGERIPRGLDWDQPFVVHSSWLQSFDTFLADCGLRPPGSSLVRLDLNQPFQPGNCYWRMRKRPNRPGPEPTQYISRDGKTLSVDDWIRFPGGCLPSRSHDSRHDNQAGSIAPSRALGATA
jgi:hypothetical protein